MKIKPYLYQALSFGALFAISATSFAGVSFNEEQVDLVIAPTCNHVPINIPYTFVEGSTAGSSMQVNSDSNWVMPVINTALNRIDVTFSTEDFIASYTAKILVNDGESITELLITATVPPLDIYRLIDDPLRSKTYGIQRNGTSKGSIIAFDPVNESLISCITVGESPTDFVINDESTELLVINSVSKSIDVINLEDFSHKETIALPEYAAWGGAQDTTANIDLGPDDIIYYSDGSWGPVLHTYKRSTQEVLQSIIFDGSIPSNNTGFMDFSVTSDKSEMVAMPQYGWSAGGHSPTIGQFDINEDGTVNFVKQTSLSNFERAPFEAPVLISSDDQVAVLKTISTAPGNTDNLKREFPSAIWSMNPNGTVVATGNKLYEYDTGFELYTIPDVSLSDSGYTYTKAQAFTSDFTRFVYFDSSSRTLNVVNLINEIGFAILGRELSPANGAVVASPEALTWSPLSGVDQYDIYLGVNETSVTEAESDSPLYLGRVTGTNLDLSQTLLNGTDYFWRIDPVTSNGPEIGTVYNFTVSAIGLSISEINAQTVIGHADYQVGIELTSDELELVWSVSAADSWISFTEITGTIPTTLNVQLDSTGLAPGLHKSTVTLSSASGELHIPVKLEVDSLNLTHIRSDRNSAISYAISEDNSSAFSTAYLLEIDSIAEKILRVIPVGSSVTDFTIHYTDSLIYVTNWKSGNLLAIDKNTFEHINNHAFQPAGATGYGDGDVYRVSAGASERLVVEEEDQWVDISIFNTKKDTNLNTAFVREGGGAFGSAGRYYYHGENNSSGASIIKFDTAGDTFTNLVEVRPAEISSYYGSRTVVISEDGSRIFWAGVVLDESLDTEWGIGEIIYSTSSDGQYAFGESVIYDVNLKRPILAMPADTQVSGYNSTSEKLIAQSGNIIGFYSLSSASSIPSPTLTFTNSTDNSIELSWTDESLEMEFTVQQRLMGTDTWEDVQTTSANVNSWNAGGLENGVSYEFRVRASAFDYVSPWSEPIIKQGTDVIDVIGRMLSPADGAVVNSLDSISWTPIPWIEQYDLYLGTEEASLVGATTESSDYLGRVTGESFELIQTLTNGTMYFLRIDPILELGPETGVVSSFTVSDIGVDVAQVNGNTFAGHGDYQIDVQLSSEVPGLSWSVTASSPWVTFTENTGSTPSTLSVHLDSTALTVGVNNASITLTSETGQVDIPVRFLVDPINITHIRSDKFSATVYAISEDTSTENSQAYLLEIDSSSEKIQRVIPVGSFVTDFTIHYEDNLIYVANWKHGILRAIDKTTFKQVNSHIFQPAGATGYGDSDVYRVSAGVSGRIIVEEEDQWVDISIFNTETDIELNKASVREGGGAFGPAGRFYYHGENNSSGASIIKFDTTADTFTNLVEVRPAEISNYYGSRTVVVSEDGSRIFWAGVALDQNLETIWQTGETIYATSTDGQYAFGEDAIYDVNLKRQILAMPDSNKVSGYNSTSDKWMASTGGVLKYHTITSLNAIPAPTLTVSNVDFDSIELAWVDQPAETSFVIQQRVEGSKYWSDLFYISQNDSASWTSSSLNEGTTYEYRLRPNDYEDIASFSNLVSSTTPYHEAPIAVDDEIELKAIESISVNITSNDTDLDGEINPASIIIVTQPNYGEVIINVNGEITYTPGNNFIQHDSFSYTIKNYEGVPSLPATASLVFMPVPSLSVDIQTNDSLELSWTGNYEFITFFVTQQRILGSDDWLEIGNGSEKTNIEWDGAIAGLKYEFRVRADSGASSSAWSNILTVTAPIESEVTPEEPVVIPEEPVVTPEEPVVIPEEPVVIPEEPVVTPEEPVVTPEEPVVTPEEPVVTPEEPVVTPEQNNDVAEETSGGAFDESSILLLGLLILLFRRNVRSARKVIH